ncbi:MAG: 3-oxoacyl-(acyl-carrier-protein) synthase 2 [Synergistetes bacterium ADurb.Bin155]|nr:beta-ketoacyl-ACP synthase II [Synergistales bacterium]MBP8996506.1 beta-ketoacyl-ACP synthase II [Synergistales bacterium]NMD18513.1 beta-ketoacyl-ACP synthase II [Synergistaceae bacterium]OQB45298.1 MAG: 3-oxoacyl-(acyl-carrier-protein) synthase 2 [Synergistetes bacterium ADurb.Bin155]HOC81836.1 beta-ketoacyl-ACP synthase II [Synergistales bacterium]
MRRVVITGMGVISPIANGREEYWKSLKEGRNGVGEITLFDPADFAVRIAAEVQDFDPERWMDRKEARRADRVIQFAVGASDMAVNDASLDVDCLDPDRFGVFIGSGEGGISTMYEGMKVLMEKGPSRVGPFCVPMMLSNMPAAYVAIRFGAKGPNICVVTACATATHTMGEAFHTIVRDDADVILAGGTEAAITPVAVAGFAAMKALSTRNEDPLHASRPFDIDRDGFVMGEGAGVLVFEELEHARKRGARIFAEVKGFGSTCDAYHITAPDPQGEGPAKAMVQAVKKAGWGIDEVDLINAHGTSTILNDTMESSAINRAFGEFTGKILVHSTKSMIGHTLGAAGALESIAALQALVEGIVHPTTNCVNPDPECRINVVPDGDPLKREVSRVLVNNFGFGGHNAVMAVERFQE